MSKLSIDIPDELWAKLEMRAAESGHGSVEQFVVSVLKAEAEICEDDFSGEPPPNVRSEEELEKLLIERMKDDPAGDIEVTPAFWQQMRERARAKGAGGGKMRS